MRVVVFESPPYTFCQLGAGRVEFKALSSWRLVRVFLRVVQSRLVGGLTDAFEHNREECESFFSA